VIESPEDDGPRLVYADWLDEQGEHDRAEFIRLQIELARLTPDHPKVGSLKAREQELLAQYALSAYTRSPHVRLPPGTGTVASRAAAPAAGP
jgi:uncharacterized protein (TIGR02996 family)